MIEEGEFRVAPHREGFVDSYLDIVDTIPPDIIDMPPVRMVELFAGIGAVRKAMTNLGIPHTSVMSEIDRWAVKSYNAIHGETENLGDISKIPKLPECDLLVYGFPCTDISIAGGQAGFEEGSGTRSSLLWEVKRLISGLDIADLPRVLIMENVAQLMAKKNRPGFDRWMAFLTSKGYKSTWGILQPYEFGLPQNRPRVFMVSVLGGRKFKLPAPTTDARGIPAISGTIDHLSSPYIADASGINPAGIRQLTPRECWKLMGFSARDVWKASHVCSDSQLYKQAGNSIAVPVIQAILEGIYVKKTFETSCDLSMWI
jgi:site-specific DNA-cytosine methylase